MVLCDGAGRSELRWSTVVSGAQHWYIVYWWSCGKYRVNVAMSYWIDCGIQEVTITSSPGSHLHTCACNYCKCAHKWVKHQWGGGVQRSETWVHMSSNLWIVMQLELQDQSPNNCIYNYTSFCARKTYMYIRTPRTCMWTYTCGDGLASLPVPLPARAYLYVWPLNLYWFSCGFKGQMYMCQRACEERAWERG